MSTGLEGTIPYGPTQLDPWRTFLFNGIAGTTVVETFEQFDGKLELQLQAYVTPSPNNATDNIEIQMEDPIANYSIWSQNMTVAGVPIDIVRHMTLDASEANIVLKQNFTSNSRLAHYVLRYRLIRNLAGLWQD